MKTKLVCSLLALSGMLAGAAPDANPAKAGMDPEALARIPVRMQSFVDKGAIAGAVTLVQRWPNLATSDLYNTFQAMASAAVVD
jgi:hypothetical protein